MSTRLGASAPQSYSALEWQRGGGPSCLWGWLATSRGGCPADYPALGVAVRWGPPCLWGWLATS
eukprot:2998052-Pyramimonas_sp.AAC.1